MAKDFKHVVDSYDPSIKTGWLLSDVQYHQKIAGEEWYTAVCYENKDGHAVRLGTKRFVLNDVELTDAEAPKSIYYT